VNRRLLLALVGVPVLLAGCGQSSPSGTVGDSHVTSDGSTMSADQMEAMGSGSPAPSETASMICSDDDIADAVRRKLDLPSTPVGRHTWSATRRLFTCTFRVPGGGDLRLSVKDLDTAGPGRAYFDALRSRLPAAHSITGLENFGFPAFETPRGDVVFIKDHKTLHVDASRLAASDLPAGLSRTDAAYGVAAAVIACWTE
jgi:hypothetical protein